MTVARNPVLPGCYPDPSICRAGDDFYLVTSTFEYLPGLPVLHSRDLVRWEQVGHVVERPGQLDYAGVRASGGLYAPTLRHHDGVFWLVCTLVGTPDGAPEGNFVMTATDPAGPWSDPVWLRDEDGTPVAGIDPSLFFDDDGRVWLHGTRLAAEPEWEQQTEVWVRELDPVRRCVVGEEHVVWTGAVRGAVWAEGPHLYRVDGTYYLLAAEGGTDFHHAVSVARAPSVTGPYEGSKANPVLTHRHLGRGADVVGVGHADLVEAVDGSWWAVLLGMRTEGGYHYPLGRETFLAPVAWEDGWPVLAPGAGRVPAEVDVPFAADDAAPGPVQGAASGVVPPGDPRWTAVRALPSEVATPRGDGWDLPVRPASVADRAAPAFLGIRLQHREADVRAAVLADLPAGETVGLVVRQSDDDHVRLDVTGGDDPRAVAVHRQAGQETVLGEAVLPGARGDVVTLGLDARGAELVLVAGVGDGPLAPVAVADARTLDSVATGGFLGLWVGVHATSHGRPTTSVARVERVTSVPRD
ncbi:glycoside hydrolase family 43 protein [Cellulosimicrobium marinum]|uniref:glycoside hydrolase family 43 protein n=1 Tax=Cellulosimicrobium marinum TaxID=1638992 RepID=UPI001E5DC62B|nr:glycoside hydrolase family 43 protein [Cellulosimicrobium marinum]MCB7136153.1 glycoside hydrolase family 43 protein [Cellulosimicrobium marinum]